MKRLNDFEIRYLKKYIHEDITVQNIPKEGSDNESFLRLTYNTIPYYIPIEENRKRKIEALKQYIENVINKYKEVSNEEEAVKYIDAMLHNKHEQKMLDIMFDIENTVLQPILKNRIGKIYKKNKKNFDKTYIECIENIPLEALIKANKWDKLVSWIILIKRVIINKRD